MYKTIVTEIGELVPAFAEERLVVLFGPEATSELRAISVIHEAIEKQENALVVGRTLTIGTQRYEIIKVGAAANKNFDEHGHVSVYFQEGIDEVLPGAIIVGPGQFPEINVGNTIEIHP